MTEIPPIGDLVFLEWSKEEDPPLAETIGRVAFYSFALIGFVALLPAIARKRTIIVVQASASLVEASVPLFAKAIEPVSSSLPPCSNEEKGKIEDLITVMGKYGAGEMSHWTFATYTFRFLNYEQELDPIHPFQFLGIIFSSPALKKHMKAIFSSKFLKSKFMNGLSQKMEREQANKNLMPLLPSFAQIVGISEAELIPYIQAHAWENLVLHLIAKSGAPPIGKSPE